MKLTKVQAIDQSILIWERMAITGELKWEAIRSLYKEGKLPTGDYRSNCPLCEYSVNQYERRNRTRNDCWSCPWKGGRTQNFRCCYSHSTYYMYHEKEDEYNFNSDNIIQIASNMVKYLKSLKEGK